MDSRSNRFLSLPLHPEQRLWSANVQKAHQLISETYNHATLVLRQENHDPLRLHSLAKKIVDDSLPLLEALHLEIADVEWAEVAAEALARTLVDLERAGAMAANIE